MAITVENFIDILLLWWEIINRKWKLVLGKIMKVWISLKFLKPDKSILRFNKCIEHFRKWFKLSWLMKFLVSWFQLPIFCQFTFTWIFTGSFTFDRLQIIMFWKFDIRWDYNCLFSLSSRWQCLNEQRKANPKDKMWHPNIIRSGIFLQYQSSGA